MDKINKMNCKLNTMEQRTRTGWLCTNSTKNMLVKIVHPGGHVELHDRPILAAEVMLRNPRCIVAHPHVFQQPWAIVAPDTMLMLGQKFYVVPISTIRKLQRLAFKYSPSPENQENGCSSSNNSTPKDDERNSTCWFFTNNNNNNNVTPKGPHSSDHGCFSDDSCFNCLITGNKIKENNNVDQDSSEGARSSNCTINSSETTRLTKKRNRDSARGSSPRRSVGIDWQPRLESIVEE